jgi:hypothetical protein
VKFKFCRQIFEKNVQISNFKKIRQVGADLSLANGHMGRQTHVTKLTVAFRNLRTSLLTRLAFKLSNFGVNQDVQNI